MNPADYGVLLSILLLFAPFACAQTATSDFSQISGMYSFEHEGEFVQITVEMRSAKADKTKPLAVTGFISRYADGDSDRGAFLDYFISKGSLDGEKLTFQTKTVHGINYTFAGRVLRGSAVSRDKDGYYEVRGTLTQNAVSQERVVSAKSREITMKLLPDLDSAPPKTK